MNPVNKFLLPNPKPSYRKNEFETLCYVPRNFDSFKKNGLDVEDAIPCLYFASEKSLLCANYILYSHGNACDLGHIKKDLVRYAKNFNANVLAYEYKGYGITKGTPSPKSIKRDIQVVYNFLTTILAVPSKNIILFGRSIGTGPSLFLASEIERNIANSLGGVILQSPYTTIRDVVNDKIGFVGNMCPKIFDNIANIAEIKCPILLIHGCLDDIIPYQMSEKLFEMCTSPNKTLELCPESTHNRWYFKKNIISPIKLFMKSYFEPTSKCNPKNFASDEFKPLFVNLGGAVHEEVPEKKNEKMNDHDLVFHQPVVDYDMASSDSDPRTHASSQTNTNSAKGLEAKSVNSNAASETGHAANASPRRRSKNRAKTRASDEAANK